VGEKSRLVVSDGWGYVEVGGLGRFRDAKLWPGGGRAWDWREAGTDHDAGIGPADVTELLEHDPGVVVLGCGRQNRLTVQDGTLSVLRQHGVDVVCQETAAAIATYNALVADGRRVGALLHTTC